MKIMVTVRGDFVSPRFDMSSEVIIATCYDGKMLEEPRSLILSDVSAEVICDLGIREGVSMVICGGIEEQHYQFFTWKNITVYDGVIGPHAAVLEMALRDALEPGIILSGVRSREVAS